MKNISDWPIESIMQLPRRAFGQRWLVITNLEVSTETIGFVMAKAKLPDRIVLWSITVQGTFQAAFTNYIKFALGEKAPADEAEFDLYERIFKGDLENQTDEGGIYLPEEANMRWTMKKMIETQGRQLVVEFNNRHTTLSAIINVAFEISSVPRSLPEWLFLEVG